MTRKKISEAITGVSSRYIEETADFRSKGGYSHTSEAKARPRFGRRFSAAMIAAIMTVFLMGAGVVAAIYGSSIQSWFNHFWEEITGEPMSANHAAIVDTLSQKIDISQTVGDVTITVDSATVGDDTFFLLLKAKGIDFSEKHGYDFQMVTMETNPDPLKYGAFVGYGVDYLGLDGDGAALFLLDYDYLADSEFAQDTRPLQVWLTLKDFSRDAHTDNETVLTEGEWYYTFIIDRSTPIEPISLPDTEVMAWSSASRAEVPVTVTNIELTNTGLRFQYDYKEGELSLSEQRIVLVLKNGKIVVNSGGIGSPTADNTDMCFSYQWLVPVDLDEIASIQIGNVEILVP